MYQWWCNEELLIKILKKLKINFDECKNDLEKKDIKPSKGNNCGVESGVYYCIYVGDTINLRRRIKANHINGKVRCSTFRKTIAAVLIGEIDEKRINTYLDKCYVEWQSENAHDYHDKQNQKIEKYFRPLNNDDILACYDKYTEKRGYNITSSGKYKRSSAITQLRSNLT